ncbi:hypothetical protein PTKIN_Ptkin01aG0344000 [Pterospermum kingtungense]
MKQEIKKAKRLLTHGTDSCRLKPGDHIYAYRGLHAYSHHGIYVGEDRVIHFIPTEIVSNSNEKPPCPKCQYQHNVHRGLVRTCLHCFSKGAPLRLYQYETSSLVKLLKISGTCSTSKCLSPETVVHKANELRNNNSFGRYDVVDKNCEHFATFCKTGTATSEQVNDYKSVPMVSTAVSKIKNKIRLSSG